MNRINCSSNTRMAKSAGNDAAKYDAEVCGRHILAMGQEFQERMSAQCIGLVAVGGIGMILLELLLHLAPQELIIADFDRVAVSNLNRLLGATPKDAQDAIFKTELAARLIQSYNPSQEFQIVQGNFLDRETQEQFKECDVLFVSVDNVPCHLAGHVFGLAHGIPVYDLGTGVSVKDGRLNQAGSQVIRVDPSSGFCPVCAGIYDLKDPMPELMDDDERARQQVHLYVSGADIPQPQVYALNMMVASWAVWMYMRDLAGERLPFDGIAIDAKDFETNTWIERRFTPNHCPICGPDGLALAGDWCELLTRHPRSSGGENKSCTCEVGSDAAPLASDEREEEGESE